MNAKQFESLLAEILKSGDEPRMVVVQGEGDTLCPICTTPRWREFHRPEDCKFRIKRPDEMPKETT